MAMTDDLTMDETTFTRLVDKTLAAIEQTVEDSSADIEYDTVGGILTLECANGSQVIINRNSPLRQIWVAARSGGFHLDWQAEPGRWVCRLNGETLPQMLQRVLREQAGVELVFG